MLIKKFVAVVACCLMASSSVAQDAAVVGTAPTVTTPAVAAATSPAVVKAVEKASKVKLSEKGALEGKAFRTDSTKVPSDVKVTLSSEGKVVASVAADEEGNFSFANVAPGAYQILGSSDGFVGSQSFDVVDYSSPVVGSPCSVGMCGATSDIVYDSYASEPVASFSSSCGACSSPCNTCGGGLGGGSFGGRLGGRLGGGLLSNGRIGLVGLAGLAGLAGSDDGDDVSPTN